MATNQGTSGPANAAKSSAAEMANNAKKLFDSSAKMVGILQMALTDFDHHMGEMLMQTATETMELARVQLEEAKDTMGKGMRAMSADATSTSFFTTGMQQNSNSGASFALSRSKKRRPSCELDKESYENATTRSDGGRSKKNKVETEKRMPFLFGSAIRSTPTSTCAGSAPAAPSSSAAQPSASPAGTRKVSDEIDAGATWRATEQVLEMRKIVKVDKKRSAVKSNVEESGGITSTFASVKLAPSSAKEPTKPDVKSSVFASINLTPSTAPEIKTATKKSNDDGAEAKKADPSFIAKDEADTDNYEIHPAADEEMLYEVDKARRKKRVGNKWKTYETGKLRIYRHKQTLKYGMAIRNQIGQVQFNVGISQGMEFLKEVKDGAKGKAAYVRFVAVEYASMGLETFLLQVGPEVVDEFHGKLEELANSV